MSDHLVLYVDHLIRPVAPVEPVSEPADPVPSAPREAVVDSAAAGPSCSTATAVADDRTVEQHAPNEEEPLIQAAECRICQEEDSLNNLETPCACSGSLKVLPLFYYLLNLNLNNQDMEAPLNSVQSFSLRCICVCAELETLELVLSQESASVYSIG